MMCGIVLSLYRNGKANTGITVGIPIGPAIIDSGLPEMPQSTVLPDDKEFQATNSALGNCWRTAKPSPSRTVGVPIGPAIIDSSLPEVPQGAVLPNDKEFQSAISAWTYYR